MHGAYAITYPRCDGAIDDIVIHAFGIRIVLELFFHREYIFDKPIDEFAVTTTDDKGRYVSAFSFNVCMCQRYVHA